MTLNKLLLSIIIPVFNEEKTIGTVLDNVSKLNLNGLDIEVIIIDDGSKDKSKEIIERKISGKKNYTLISHKKNKGKGAAVNTGFSKAEGEILLIQDADLEYNPKDIPKLLAPLVQKKEQVVYGTRLRRGMVLFGKNKTPLPFHFVGNKFLSLVTSILYGVSITDMETGYKVFTRNVLKGMKLKARSFDFEPELTAKILRKGYKILEIDISTNPRGYDEGKKIRPVRDGVIALWTLVKYRFVS